MPVKAMRYGIWTRWAAAAVFASLAACTAEEWAQFNKEMEQNQRAAAERRVKYRKIRVQCSDWEMADTAAASLSSKGFRVMYPGEDGYGAVATVSKTAQEHVLIRNGNYFTTLPGPNTRPGYRTKVTVTVHNLAGRKLAEYQGESVPSEPSTAWRRPGPPAARPSAKCRPALPFTGRGGVLALILGTAAGLHSGSGPAPAA